jgi:hypothetical protein
MIASVLVHEHGLMKGAPPEARVVPFLNKVETRERHRAGVEVARMVLRPLRSRCTAVVLGRLFFTDPVVDVVR